MQVFGYGEGLLRLRVAGFDDSSSKSAQFPRSRAFLLQIWLQFRQGRAVELAAAHKKPCWLKVAKVC